MDRKEKFNWRGELIKAGMWVVLTAVSSGIMYCLLWKYCTHKFRIWMARSASDRAAAGMEAGLTPAEDLPPPPPEEPDRVSISSSGTSQRFVDAQSSQQDNDNTVQKTVAESADTQTSTTTAPTPVTTPPTPQEGSHTTVGSRVAGMFRSAAHAVGYPAGVPLDPSATGVLITHDNPVPQAADHDNPDKRLRPKKKAPPPVAPKPTSRSRSRGRPRKGSSVRLASPRHSLRKRTKKS